MLERTDNTLLFEVSKTPVFDFNIRFFDKSDIKLFLEQDGGGSLSLIPGTDYSVEDKDDYSDGAKITLNIGSRNLPQLPSGKKLAISRILPLHQTLNLPENGKIPSTGLEIQLDRIVMQIQQLAEKLGRTIAAPPTSGTPDDPGTPDAPGTPDDPYQIIMEGLATVNLAIETCTSLVKQAAWWANEAAAAGGAAEFHLSYDVYGETQLRYPTIVEPGPDDPGVPDYPQLPHGSQIFWEKAAGKAYYGEDDDFIQSVRIIPGENFPGDAIVFFTI